MRATRGTTRTRAASSARALSDESKTRLRIGDLLITRLNRENNAAFTLTAKPGVVFSATRKLDPQQFQDWARKVADATRRHLNLITRDQIGVHLDSNADLESNTVTISVQRGLPESPRLAQARDYLRAVSMAGRLRETRPQLMKKVVTPRRSRSKPA